MSDKNAIAKCHNAAIKCNRVSMQPSNKSKSGPLSSRKHAKICQKYAKICIAMHVCMYVYFVFCIISINTFVSTEASHPPLNSSY